MTEPMISLLRYEKIVELANEGIWTLDAEDRTDYINGRGAAMLGYRPEELIGQPATIFAFPELVDVGARKIREFRAGKEESFEAPVRRKDGSAAWISLSVRPLFDADGNYDGAMAVFSDITKRKRDEEALHHSQQMLQLVLDSVPDRVFWKDRELRFLGCNKNFARDAGLEDPSEIVGKNDYELTWRDSAASYQADDRRVMESGIPKINFEEMQIHSDGSVLWLKTSKVPLRDADGTVIGVLGTYDDITGRKEAEKRLEEYSRQLERSNEELQQFAYVASHDLQEPLRMVILYLALLNKKFGSELSPQAMEYVSTAVEGAERMRRLVNDLLEYSRVETRVEGFSPVDMNKVAEAMMDDLRAAIDEAGAEITVGRLPTVLADEVQMKQVLTNLVSNAIKYRSAVRPTVRISASDLGSEVVFSVRDNGIGIDPKYHQNIFQMFQRLHLRDEYPGTGIGLAISKKIVERHGGRIWVESREGEGATFCFTLPSMGGAVSRQRV